MTARQPAGIPTGGQFAPGSQGRAGVALLDDTDPMTVHPIDLHPGDVFYVQTPQGPVETEILSEQEPYEDQFGRQLFKYLARRSDNGVEGYMGFGPTAIPLHLERRAETAPAVPELDWFDDEDTLLAETADGYLLSVRPDDGPHGPRFAYEVKHGLGERPLHPLVTWYADTEDEAKAAAALAASDGLPADYDGPRVAPDLMRAPGFLHAVRTSRNSIPTMKKIAAEWAWCGYSVARVVDHTGAVDYRPYKADAWTEPSERPMLPWSPPRGTRVAHVDMDGRLTPFVEDPAS